MTHFRPLPRRLPRLDLAVRVPTGRRDLGHRRILGAGFSLFAALGTSIYQADRPFDRCGAGEGTSVE